MHRLFRLGVTTSFIFSFVIGSAWASNDFWAQALAVPHSPEKYFQELKRLSVEQEGEVNRHIFLFGNEDVRGVMDDVREWGKYLSPQAAIVGPGIGFAWE